MAITIAPGQIVGQGDWDALFAQHGWVPDNSPPTRRAPAEAEIKAAALAGDTDPATQQRPIYRYALADGSYVDARTSPDGRGYEIIDYKPSQAFTASQRKEEGQRTSTPQEGETRGPQTGPKREVWRNGAWTVEDNPVYQTPAERPEGQPKEGDTRGPQTGPKREVWRGGTWTLEDNPTYQAPAERQEGQPRDGDIRGPQTGPTREVYRGGKWTTEPNPVYQKPDEKPAQQQSPYTSVQQDKDSGKWFGLTRDGKWQEIPGGPGNQAPAAAATPGRPAPSLPQIVVGNSQDALRTAYDEIQAEVDAGRRTPAWGENRRKEVFDAAQLTVREAQLHEQSRQFNQSQAQTLATTKLQYGQGALRNAMQWALQINDKIDPGSPAGANLFRATFMLQMKMARDSGIYDIKPGGGQSSVGQGMPGASSQPQRRPPLIQDIDKPEKLAEHANTAAENIRAGLEADGSPRQFTPAQGGPSQPMPATPSQPVPAQSSQQPAAPPPPPRDPTLTSPMQAPGSGQAMKVRDPWGNEFEMTQQQMDNRPGGSSDLTVVGPAAPVAAPAPPASPAPQAMTPDPSVPRFAALEQFRRGDTPPMDPSQPMPDQVVVPPNPADPPIVGAMPPAIRHAQISSTPPWRLPPDQIDGLVDEFGPDVVFKWPGMEGAA